LGEDIARTRYAMLYAPVRVGAKRRVVSERPIRNMHALFLLTFTTPSRLVHQSLSPNNQAIFLSHPIGQDLLYPCNIQLKTKPL